MDIEHEYSELLSLRNQINTSVEEARLVHNDIKLKERLKYSKNTTLIKQVITDSKTGLLEVSTEDIDKDIYMSLTVSIESDRNLLQRIYDKIKAFFISLFKRAKKIVKWFGRLIGILDKELDDIDTKVNGKKGILRYTNATKLRPEDMDTLFNVLKVQYFMNTTLDFSTLINIIADIKDLDKFIKDLETLIMSDNGQMTKLVNGDISSLKTYKRTKVDTEVLIHRCEPISPSKHIYKIGNNNKPHYTKFVPLTILGNKVRGLVSLEEDKKIILWKGLVTATEYSNIALIIPFANIKVLVQAIKSMDSTDFVSKVDMLLKTSDEAIKKVITELEKTIQTPESNKSHQIMLDRVRNIGMVVSMLPTELVTGYKEGRDSVQSYIKIMDDQYI